jgi:hypothetical protein
MSELYEEVLFKRYALMVSLHDVSYKQDSMFFCLSQNSSSNSLNFFLFQKLKLNDFVSPSQLPDLRKTIHYGRKSITLRKTLPGTYHRVS